MIFLLFGSAVMPAQDSLPAPDDKQVPEITEPAYNDTTFGSIAAFSHTISSTTGIAMSPLLGMGVLGAWKYYQSDDAYRNSLPWYSNPWVWGICFGFFLLLKSKDTLGAFIPEVVKKPITVLDDISDKASALIVALAVVPAAVWEELEKHRPMPSEEGLAMAPVIFPIIAVVGAVAIFVIVWFAFNALSSIKILSPSSMINTAISVVKGAVIAVFAGLAALNPWVGLILSLSIIIFCALIFSWAFRWNVFGTLFVKDFVTGAFNKPLAPDEELKGFSTALFPGVKTRTYGRLTRDGDELVFAWKPWLVMPTRRNRIKLTEVESGARKGIFLPSVTLLNAEANRHRAVIDFRLRYRSHAEEIQSRLGLDSTQPNAVFSGFRACWEWFRDQIQRGGRDLANAFQA